MCESHAGGAGFEGMKWVGVASSRGSVSYVRARVPEERAQERDVGEGAAQAQWRPQHISNAIQ